jgi:hypothetical protein
MKDLYKFKLTISLLYIDIYISKVLANIEQKNIYISKVLANIEQKKKKKHSRRAKRENEFCFIYPSRHVNRKVYNFTSLSDYLYHYYVIL